MAARPAMSKVPVKVFLSASSGCKIEDYSHYNSTQSAILHSDHALPGVSVSDIEDGSDEDRPVSYFESVATRHPRHADKAGESEDEETSDSQLHQVRQIRYCNQLTKLPTEQESLILDLIRDSFSVLLYGFGSKRTILEKLQNNFPNYFIISIHGYFSELTSRNILNEIKDALGAKTLDFDSICEAIDDCDQQNILFMIHSLDRLITNNPKFKDILVGIATKPKVQILATVDHINSQLLFTSKDIMDVNLVWSHVPTFIPYSTERGYSVYGTASDFKRSTTLTISAVTHVYDSLTINAQRIFCLIIEYYLEKEKERQEEKEARKKKAAEKRKSKSRSKRKKRNEPEHENSENEPENDFLDRNYEQNDDEVSDLPMEPVSLSFSTLYKICREEYLANSETSLKSLLTEFQDHDIVKLSKSSDGSTSIRLRIGLEVAKAFIEKINE